MLVSNSSKESIFKDAPPTKAPSTSGQDKYSFTFTGLTEPPYKIRMPSATAPNISLKTSLMKEQMS